MIVKDNSLFFLKRRIAQRRGKGGSQRTNVERRMFKKTLLQKGKEEPGLDFEAIGFIGVSNRTYRERHDVTIVFLYRCFDEEVVLNEENSEFRFFKSFQAK